MPLAVPKASNPDDMRARITAAKLKDATQDKADEEAVANGEKNA